ncbi:hydroxyisourate hydrolase [Acidisphaera rubrifaciens]|uniref:5-hydroxyisourate hydrolase n=1 Tax=Acidisphaera rubrifaciens HS-AP3 TaxID=1231350 RepID=A0A0D6P9X3_9PROT|nr:hydroxyisourate hydrolase [Acidisphaera rubrifaciens]GAN78467.1 hypothetical protein Asru_0895_05 [Acidisphaera rubrifaciens HS-AP3]
MSGRRLTVHVLDTAAGLPAAGLDLTLERLDDAGGRTLLARVRTNDDGRSDAPLLAGAAMLPGVYEITYDVGAWQRRRGVPPGFYETIPLRIRVTDDTAHVHVPLLLSPFGYTTYRGS